MRDKDQINIDFLDFLIQELYNLNIKRSKI
jgi:hypothetical protein